MERRPILSLLGLTPSPQSRNFIEDKKQFQLHTLVTEQRHSKTWNLSSVLKGDLQSGLEQIFSVDEDISRKLHKMTEDPAVLATLQQAAEAVSRAILNDDRIFIYGCGATGRLAKQMESALWRPFWSRLQQCPLWEKIRDTLPEEIESRLIGEMTGGDRALISSLEGFEDLELMGRLQLEDRGIQRGDVVFGITEGGETSSVIGAVRAALEQYGELTSENTEDARQHIYFLYNNPDEVLRPFERSLKILDQPAITRINLTTGPQVVTGSTRMQAATTETFVMGAVLEAGIREVLEDALSAEDLQSLGFPPKKKRNESRADSKAAAATLKQRLLSFDHLREALSACLEDIACLTSLESDTYAMDRRAVYFAGKAMIPVFIDCAERSPTFHLFPLDTVGEPEKKCWLQVWTDAEDQKAAWTRFLGRPFRGLDKENYYPHFVIQITDSWLREAALRSLSRAGSEQELIYDFSFSGERAQGRDPQPGDLAVVVCVDDELEELRDEGSSFCRFVRLSKSNRAAVALVLVGEINSGDANEVFTRLSLLPEKDAVIVIPLDKRDDPLELKRQTLLKMLLNAHSTAVMARLGRVVGNTMTNVDPSNLKLIGRATHLIEGHINDVLAQEEWIDRHGECEPVTYAQANAVLYDAMDFLSKRAGQNSEVALSIIRILEALKEQRFVSWEEALTMLDSVGLEGYLGRHNPALRREPLNSTILD
jgi:N-acetylmuramic acid 6-phosphate etherase